MKRLLRLFFTFLLITIAFWCSAYFFWYRPEFKPSQQDACKGMLNNSFKELSRLQEKAVSLKEFAGARGYNKEICFLADMSIPSGKNRFFVYDLQKDSILLQGLVAHGSCDRDFQVNTVFSNTTNSGCSSLGRYKVGAGYKGRFGLAYKLYGLDSSNSNAFERNIVLHAYDCVPEQETDPLPICNSRGCPMISPGFLNRLKPVIDHSKKPVLLWMF
jgi:L,D-transpeptidase catalytic domain